MVENQTTRISNILERLKAGDDSARNDLIEHMYDRLRRITAGRLRQFPSVNRWDQTDDVWQIAVQRLNRALTEVQPDDLDGLLRLAGQHISWTLKDLARKYQGPHGLGKRQATRHQSTNRPFDPSDETAGPGTIAEFTELHQLAELLPNEEKQVFGLCYYNGLSNEEVAELIGASVRTVQRRYRSAKAWLARRMSGEQGS